MIVGKIKWALGVSGLHLDSGLYVEMKAHLFGCIGNFFPLKNTAKIRPSIGFLSCSFTNYDRGND